MKSSFYFVLWMLVYPILGLFHNSFVYENSFIIALILVWVITYMINKSIPGIISYDKRTSVLPLFESIYTGNIEYFYRKLSSMTVMSIITALYFIITAVVLFLNFINNFDDIIAVVIFVFLAYGAMKESVERSTTRRMLKSDPNLENCRKIAENRLGMDYEAYSEIRRDKSYEQLFLPRPKGLLAFQIINLIFSIISAILGLIFIGISILSFFQNFGLKFNIMAINGMYFIYGSLATYYGFIDLISIIKNLKSKRMNQS